MGRELLNGAVESQGPLYRTLSDQQISLTIQQKLMEAFTGLASTVLPDAALGQIPIKVK